MRMFDERVIQRHMRAGHWDDETIAQRVSRNAQQNPEGIAYVGNGRQMTWAAYDEQSTVLAAMLASRLAPGERVGILLTDGPLVHAVYLAAEKAGVVVVGIAPRSRQNEIAHLMGKAACRTLVTERERGGAPTAEIVRELRERGVPIEHHLVLVESVDGDLSILDDGDLARPGDQDELRGRAIGANDLWLINSTSGTTGLPKCVMQTQNRWKFFHQVAAEAGDLSSDDILMSLISAPFGFGLWTGHVTPTLLGSPCIVQPAFEPADALELIGQHRVTVLSCVSTQFILMLNSPAMDDADLSSLRVMFTGGERVPYHRAKEFEERTGCRVLQFYGSNETGALSRTTVHDSPDRRLRTAGRVIEAMNPRVVDLETGADLTGTGRSGLGVCMGPAVTPGYLDDPEANAKLFTEGGEMRTSDLITIDADGYLTVVGRDSDIVIRGGHNISAVAVEELVSAHPRVALVAVVGAPDEVFGERVCAFVVTRDDRPLTVTDVATFLNGAGVSKYMWPERVLVVDELPYAPGGKIDKAALRQRTLE